MVKYGYNINPAKIYDYVELNCNLGLISLSGKISNVNNLGPGSGNVPSYYLSINPNTPIYTNPIINCNSIEGSIVYGFGGEFDTCQNLSGQTFSLDTRGFQQNGNYGIYLKLMGQPTNLLPEIKMFDPFTNQYFYTKGQLITSCPC